MAAVLRGSANIFLTLYTVAWLPFGLFLLLLAMIGFFPTHGIEWLIVIANPIVVTLIVKYLAR